MNMLFAAVAGIGGFVLAKKALAPDAPAASQATVDRDPKATHGGSDGASAGQNGAPVSIVPITKGAATPVAASTANEVGNTENVRVMTAPLPRATTLLPSKQTERFQSVKTVAGCCGSSPQQTQEDLRRIVVGGSRVIF